MVLLRYVPILQGKSILNELVQHALVWWKSSPISSYPALDSRLPLHPQLPPQTFSLPNTPIASDTSAHTHALALESLLGGPDHMAARVGTCANASLAAAQLLRMRESDVWQRTGKVQTASSFLGSILVGKWVGMGEAEACATGIWHHGGGNGTGGWDDGVLDIIGGNREEGRRVREWLGEVDVSSGAKRAGTASRYLIERYGFDPGKQLFLLKFSTVKYIPRHYCRSIYYRLPFDLPFPMSIPLGHGSIFRSNGCDAYIRPTLPSYPPLQPLPSSRSG